MQTGGTIGDATTTKVIGVVESPTLLLAVNHFELLTNLHEPKDLTGIDVSAPAYNYSLYYNNLVIGDITQAPFLDSLSRLVWCISGLEHVGKDNSPCSIEKND